MKYQFLRFPVSTSKGFVPVNGYQITRHFAVHREFITPDTRKWCVVHLPSCLRVMPGCDTRKSAGEIAEAFQKCDWIDWKKEAPLTDIAPGDLERAILVRDNLAQTR